MQRALQFVVLLLAHVVDLLRDRRGVDFGELASPQKIRLAERLCVRWAPLPAR